MAGWRKFSPSSEPDTCLWCGQKLYQHWHDDTSKTGRYGDGLFCSLKCGFLFAVQMAQAGYRLPLDNKRNATRAQGQEYNMDADTINAMLNELVDAAYDSGYYSGQNADGSVRHVGAVNRRNAARDQLRADLARVTAAGKACAEALAETEWKATYYGDRYCVVCKNEYDEEHEEGCRVAVALAAARGAGLVQE